MDQLRTLEVLQTLHKAELDQAAYALADALSIVDERSQRKDAMHAQRLSIAQAHEKHTRDTRYLTPKALELLGAQYRTADVLLTSAERMHAQACARRDEVKAEVANAKKKVDTFERNRKMVRQLLARERDRSLSNELDDLWAGRAVIRSNAP